MLPFTRGSWKGYFLIDESHKVILAISTVQTSRRQKNKKKNNERSTPPYIPAFSYILNEGLSAPYKQLHLSDIYENEIPDFECFKHEDYLKTYEEVSDNRISLSEGYRFAVVLYEMYETELKSVILEMYDPEMERIIKKPLDDYLKPDFGSLTSSTNSPQSTSDQDPVYGLVSVKHSIKAERETEPQHITPVKPKIKEEEQL